MHLRQRDPCCQGRSNANHCYSDIAQINTLQREKENIFLSPTAEFLVGCFRYQARSAARPLCPCLHVPAATTHTHPCSSSLDLLHLQQCCPATFPHTLMALPKLQAQPSSTTAASCLATPHHLEKASKGRGHMRASQPCCSRTRCRQECWSLAEMLSTLWHGLMLKHSKPTAMA